MKKLVIIAGLLSHPVSAEPVVVRSGEHDNFTRLVFDFKSPPQWTLDERPGLLILDFGDKIVDLDASDTFRLIPRNRVKDVRLSPDESDVLIEVAPQISARMFELEGGALVLDVVSERDLGKVSPLPKPVPPKKLSLPNAESRPSGATDRLAFYWRPKTPKEQSGHLDREVAHSSSQVANMRVAEEALRQQIARAAAQGLIQVDITDPEFNAVQPVRENQYNKSEPEGPTDNLAMLSQTAVDRDNPTEDPTTTVSNEGAICASDAQLDFTEWTNGMSPADRLAEARQSLLGEFDQPDKDKVLALAKTFIAIGFGAEARSLLTELPTGDEDAALLAEIGAIIDGNQIPPNSPLLSMYDCETSAALWSILAGVPLDSSKSINTAAIIRSFSALPAELRKNLGTRLIARLIEAKHNGAAQTIRDIMSRAGGADPDRMEILNDSIITDWLPPKISTSLIETAVQSSNATNSAILLRIENMIRSDTPVDDATIDDAAALAYEYTGTLEGAAFSRAHVLSLGSVGRFDAAFQTLGQWPSTNAPDLRENTVAALFVQLSKVPSDEIFLVNILGRLASIPVNNLSNDAILNLAKRLLDQGFAQAAQKVLLSVKKPTEDTRILLSRSSLELGDGAAALAHLSGLEGTEVEKARGEAFQLLGDHANAKLAFNRADDDTAEARAAWRAEDSEATLHLGTNLQKEILSFSSQTPESTNDASATLTSSKHFLEQSRKERTLLELLLEETRAISAPSSQD